MQPAFTTMHPAPPFGEWPEILLVEDEDTARRELKRTLTRQGFRVREAVNAGDAVQQAQQGDVGLVLMDILLGDGPDGIDAAQQIQQTRPDTSIVFVSAYAHDPDYQQRAQSSTLRIGAWIDKPIRLAKIQELLRIAGKELVKSRVRGQLQEQDPLGQLEEMARHEALVSSEVVEELRQEFPVLPLRRPHPPHPPSQEELEMQISAVYDEIRNLVVSHEGDPESLGSALQPLRKQLRALQEQEAELMERRILSHFRFDPGEGSLLLQSARDLLKGRRK